MIQLHPFVFFAGLFLLAPHIAEGGESLSFGRICGKTGAEMPLSWTSAGLTGAIHGNVWRIEATAKTRGSVRTASSLLLAPLHLYRLDIETRRGPGLGVGLSIPYKTAEGAPRQRGLVMHLPDCVRPNWIPLSAYRKHYVQTFALPEGAHDAGMEIVLEGHPDAGFNFLEIFSLTLTELEPILSGPYPGGNLLSIGSLEGVDREGNPLGWSWWVGKPDFALSDQGAKEGRRFLRIAKAANQILAAAALIPIQRGHAYRLSFWARGKGAVGLGAQALDSDSNQALRVGDAQQESYAIDARDWTRFQQTWLADALYVERAQVFFSIATETGLDIDDIEFQPLH